MINFNTLSGQVILIALILFGLGCCWIFTVWFKKYIGEIPDIEDDYEIDIDDTEEDVFDDISEGSLEDNDLT